MSNLTCKRMRRHVTFAVLATAGLLLVHGNAAAQLDLPPGTIEYSAKFVCGTVPTSGSTMVLPPGDSFATSINIHNPALPNGTAVTPVRFFKKAVQSVQEPPIEGGTLPSPGIPRPDMLAADFAMEVDCAVISKLLPTPPVGFVEGWVVIYSLPTLTPIGSKPNPLDVVGVYTNRHGELYLMPAKEHDF